MLAQAPQRVDPTRKVPVDPASLFDWQRDLFVVFDGTDTKPLGRQMFVPEETWKPAPTVTAGQPKFHTELPKRVLALLQTGNYTLAGLASRLRESPERVHKVLFGLMKRHLVEVVGVDTNRDPLPGQHVRVSIYGAR